MPAGAFTLVVKVRACPYASVRDPGAVSAVEPGMKKRSMLAIATLATGFVVAAVTPSHALGEGLEGLPVGDALSTLDHTVIADGPADAADGDRKAKG